MADLLRRKAVSVSTRIFNTPDERYAALLVQCLANLSALLSTGYRQTLQP